MSLNGRVVVITGATGSLGRAVAQAFPGRREPGPLARDGEALWMISYLVLPSDATAAFPGETVGARRSPGPSQRHSACRTR